MLFLLPSSLAMIGVALPGTSVAMVIGQQVVINYDRFVSVSKPDRTICKFEIESPLSPPRYRMSSQDGEAGQCLIPILQGIVFSLEQSYRID